MIHEDVDRFVINTHSFHNAHLLRGALPREILQPVPFTSNRRDHHDQLATELRGSQGIKRAATAAKAAEKKRATTGEGNTSGAVKKRRLDRGPLEGNTQGSDVTMAGPAELDHN